MSVFLAHPLRLCTTVFVILTFACCARGNIFNMPAGQTSLQFVPIGSPSNPSDFATGSMYGAVPSVYQMGKYEVTAAQYVQFLNSKDPSGANSLGLYNDAMGYYSGVAFNSDGQDGSKYLIIANRENLPVTDVTWYSAIRFANWLHNGQASGNTEIGAYTLGPLDSKGVPLNGSAIVRNPAAQYFLPSENEWYKAAYFNPASNSYSLYGTGSDIAPNAEAPPGGKNAANYQNVVGNITDVGAYTTAANLFGVYDAAGNVWEWNEELISAFGEENRGIRGGSFFDGTDDASLRSTFRPFTYGSLSLSVSFGFRVAAVPEPPAWILAASTISLLLGRWCIRKLCGRVLTASLTIIVALLFCPSNSRAQYTLTTLAKFDGTTGWRPYCDLIADSAGNIYGTTVLGNKIFRLAAGTNELTSFASLNGTNAVLPFQRVVTDAAGNLYGTTMGGGRDGGLYGLGTIFRVDASTHAATILAKFDGTNGRNPYCELLIDPNGNLYGTTFGGGTNDLGTVFKFNAATQIVETVATFNGDNGAKPIAGLIADSQGNFYGTTQQGGIDDHGTVFKIAAGTHEVTPLVKFTIFDGYEPNARLLLDGHGKLLGTTIGGGPTPSTGTIFRLDPVTGVIETLAEFDQPNGGLAPQSGVIADAAGNLFGTTYSGGTFNLGTVFKYDASTHELSTLVSFDDANGSNPTAGLFLDAEGNLYGTTSGNFGDQSGYGTIFKLSPVPEPAAALLFATGLLSVAVRPGTRWARKTKT